MTCYMHRLRNSWGILQKPCQRKYQLSGALLLEGPSEITPFRRFPEPPESEFWGEDWGIPVFLKAPWVSVEASKTLVHRLSLFNIVVAKSFSTAGMPFLASLTDASQMWWWRTSLHCEAALGCYFTSQSSSEWAKFASLYFVTHGDCHSLLSHIWGW